MSSYMYCDNCNRPLNKPTPQEDLIEGFPCPDCGKIQPNMRSTDEWIVELFDKIKELEDKIHDLEFPLD